MENDHKAKLKKLISDRVFIKNTTMQIGLSDNPNTWLFDFRRVLMNGQASDLITDIFYEKYSKHYPFQIGTLEIGGVPLATSIVNKFFHKRHEDINGFFVRKSRKKTGTFSMIEGELDTTKKIILVDDIMNSGNSFWRQIEVLEEYGYKVDTVWSIVRYRDIEYYRRFEIRGIKVESLFTLDDFTESLGSGVKNLTDKFTPTINPFTSKWIFKSEKPSLGHVLVKSQPVLDEDTIYFGSDNETFWAINQTDGSIKWSFKVGRHTMKKSIFSNPTLYKNLVIFGSYDGNVYALNKNTGKQVWVSFEADWVGSSPEVAPELGLVFVGLEFGLFKKKGGLIALDINNGKTVWIDKTHSALTHASPKYIERHEQVAIGSNEGVVRMYNARTGELIWSFTTFGGADYDEDLDGGFSRGEIKESLVYYEEKDYLIFGATDGFLYILNRENGNLVHHYKCQFAIWSTPFIYTDKVYFTSLDKRVRCINLNTFELVFEKNVDGTRIFGSPIVIDDSLYVGTNAARLHELNPETGESIGYYQTLERITNYVTKNNKTGLYYLPTYANEIICLEKNTFN